MELAITLAGGCESEKNETGATPRVGAVLARGSEVIAEGFRGKSGAGDHAEYSVLGKKADGFAKHATLFTTLEPCTVRGPNKKPCSRWVVESGVSHVYIGMLDPNRTIQGDGFWSLREANIDVSFFDPDLIRRVEEQNAEFIRTHRPPRWLPPWEVRRLDDWYFIINGIYIDKNVPRSTTWIFAHLVEVIGGLSSLASERKKPGVKVADYVAKTLGWWFALCASVGVKSVEELIWAKFPGICSYCHRRPHATVECDKKKALQRNPEWARLVELGEAKDRPRTFDGWKNEFGEIYPLSQSEKYDSVFARLAEELGELAECVRVIDVAPASFISEAADVFAWLMHLVNLYEYKEGTELNLGRLLWNIYADRCPDCKYPVCACPPLLGRTVKRIAHEGPSDAVTAALFLAPHEKLERFNVGTTVLVVGDQSLPVTYELVQAVFQLSQDISSDSHMPGVSREVLLRASGWSANMTSFAAAQRVSQKTVDDFLLFFRSSDPDQRAETLRLIQKTSQNPLRNALLTFFESV